MKMVLTLLQLLVKFLIFLVLAGCWAWGSMALYFTAPGPQWMRTVLAVLFVILLPASFLLSRRFYRGVFLCAGGFAILLVWWQTLEPTNDKDWAADVAQISHGTIEGETLTMHNVRNFDYIDQRTPIPKWETRTYDLANLKGLDIFLSYWASEHIAHTILSWDFGSDGHLAISIETRKDKTQEYSALKGFFKQFGLSYVAATEHDIIRLRTNYRKERVYLYRLRATPEQSLVLLEEYLREMNLLVNEPKFYNALTRNCTTTIEVHANAVREDGPPPLDWRLILSGHVDELLYDRHGITRHLPFDELRQQSRIDLDAQRYTGDDYSGYIRERTNQFKTN